MEPENGGHTYKHTNTHTQSKYCNPRAHARRTLIIPSMTIRDQLCEKGPFGIEVQFPITTTEVQNQIFIYFFGFYHT